MKAQFMTPVVTAFDAKGNLDIEGNKRVYDHLIKGGIDGIVVMGSTGEFFSMSLGMQKELVDIAVNHINRRTRVLIGASRMSVAESIELASHAHAKGADGVMIVSPYYFNLPDESVAAYYSEIASGTQAKIYLYNFPDRTGYSMSPSLVLGLARKHANIVGIKDTVLDMIHTSALIRAIKPELPDFEIYSGYDNNFAHNIISGGNGCIGGLSNLVPEVCSAWARACDAGDLAKITELQRYIDDMMALYGISTPFIPTMKKAMMLRGIQIQDYCTKPIMQVNESQTAAIKGIMQKLHIQ